MIDRAAVPLLATIAVVIVIAALAAADTVFAPMAFAVFVVSLFWPLQSALQARLPQGLALLVTTVVMVAILIVFGSLISWAVGRVARSLIADYARFQILYDQAVVWLEGHGVAVAGAWSEHFNTGWLLRTLQGITGRLNSTMTFWLVVLVYVILGLMEVDLFRRKLADLSRPGLGRLLLAGGAATATKFRRYMVVRTWMSALTGVLVWAFTAAIGLGHAPEWGVVAFTLNYIPVIGPVIATVFPTMYALIQYGTLGDTLAVLAGLNLIQFVIGNYIEPRVSGAQLSMSPALVLFAVFFWTWLWGLFGAFIGVPILIAVLTFCGEHPGTRWIAELFGSGPRPAAAASDP
jgi:predicted PurR-regulated permease PerM